MAVCSGRFEQTEKHMRSPRSLKAVAFGIALSWCNSITQLSGQSNTAGIEHTDSLRGTVVNGVTHEPISRALVFSRSEEHTSELQSLTNLVCRLLLEKKNHKRDYDHSKHHEL